ncbi:hypothetical protein MLD38_026662 [Melastoma candidum]|uniref:Uncharacterized protein n=1 Tax=Melastoma candidum TaxID=119954 RepID=A0ACB9NZ31_9MYRT|nr:hypothetical protein MLD38_026662 [Melastoma candidum]
MADDLSRSPKVAPTTTLSTLLGMRTKSSSIFDIANAYKFIGRKLQGHNHRHGHHYHCEKGSPIHKDEGLKGGEKKGKRCGNTNGDDNESTRSLLLSQHKKTAADKFHLRRSFLLRSGSRRSHEPTLSSLSRSMSARNENQSNGLFGILSRNKSSRKSVSTSRQSVYMDEGRLASIKRSMSSTRGNMDPILFSQNMAQKVPPPIEKKLECTLEELCFGGVKYVIITRDVLTETGIIQEEESLKINIKPGWRNGTKITFEGKGNEKLGELLSDIVLLIAEKRHPMFKRRGDNLEIEVEIPLVQALTGCLLSVPLLGGEKMNIYVDEVIFPGYKKEISGQGMPDPKGNGKRGDLKITFVVRFPSDLSNELKSEIRRVLDQESS